MAAAAAVAIATGIPLVQPVCLVPLRCAEFPLLESSYLSTSDGHTPHTKKIRLSRALHGTKRKQGVVISFLSAEIL